MCRCVLSLVKLSNLGAKDFTTATVLEYTYIFECIESDVTIRHYEEGFDVRC